MIAESPKPGIFEREYRTLKSVFADKSPFATYGATLQFRDRLVGGTPKDPKVVRDWMMAKVIPDDDQFTLGKFMEVAEEAGIPVPDGGADWEWFSRVTKEVADTKNTQGFKSDEHGLYIEARQAKALIKEAANILWPKRQWGVSKKGTKSFWAERIHVEPYRVHVNGIAGVDQFIGHIKGPQGPQSTVSYYEFVDQPMIEMEIEVLDDCIEQDDWAKLWAFAERNGLGAKRSQGFGQFVIVRWEKLS